MATRRSIAVQAVVMVLLLGMMVGCGTRRGPVGGQAYAQKTGAPPASSLATGGFTQPTIDDDPLRGRPAGVSSPISEVFPELCQRIHFDFDRSEIKPEFRECLDRIVTVLRQHTQYTLVIEGHTDERGSDEYNMGLGERRAQSTSNYLVQRGLGANRILIRSKGEHEPLATCSEERCWRLNRRAEFFVLLEHR